MAPLLRELAGRLSGRPVVCARVALAAGAGAADKGRVLLGVGRVAERALKQKTVALPASGLQVWTQGAAAYGHGWARGRAARRRRRAGGAGAGGARRHAGPVSAAPAAREPLEFAALFANWRWCDKRRDNRLRVARSATTRLDAVSLAANAWLAAEAQLPDDGSGALRVWRVRAGGAAEVERAQAAVFFAADCFLGLYTYHAPTATSPYSTTGWSYAWVYQGKEPAHFLQIFKGRMITYVGSADDYDLGHSCQSGRGCADEVHGEMFGGSQTFSRTALLAMCFHFCRLEALRVHWTMVDSVAFLIRKILTDAENPKSYETANLIFKKHEKEAEKTE
ncbi:hypothetical protein MSG28_003072 [Choristoneura fumiferana]|uniref:Uncharacterized protein n=1 Tax=Choristoneura fumiferana TaxID=7141 RepID=A0ACC0JLB4_CHOFU|nr:hypothetical protein MSG28_003072 [Choristoneura fumiferana]